MGDELNFDPNALTLGDLEDFEDVTGVPFGEVLGSIKVTEDGVVKMPTARALTALVWILKRSEDPGFSLDDAKKMSLGALSLKADVEDRPTDAAGSNS